MSQEFLGALVIIVVSVLDYFGIKIGNEAISSIVTGIAGIWVLIRRYQRGDITLAGTRK